jgi:hypothetical protein
MNARKLGIICALLARQGLIAHELVLQLATFLRRPPAMISGEVADHGLGLITQR